MQPASGGSGGARERVLNAMRPVPPPEADTPAAKPPPVAATGEAPVLAARVAAGGLPPVAQRLPETPLVLDGPDGPGVYGGTWLRVATSETDVDVIGWRLSAAGPLRWSPLGDPIVEHVAESVEASADLTTYTVRLRRGHRWSDGHPFTADDVAYWWEHEVHDPAVAPNAPPPWMMHEGKPPAFERVDRRTFRFRFDTPHALFRARLASFGWQAFDAPAHFLRRFHPSLGDPAELDAEAARFGLPSHRALYRHVKSARNPEHPRLWPWVCRSFSSNPPHAFVRNPYYFAVDAAGRQLPYIDQVRFEVRREEQVPLEVAAGKVTMQARHLRFDDVTEYLTRQAEGSLSVRFWPSANGSEWVIQPNQNRRAAGPVGAYKAQLLGTADFRRALSLAIDRPRILEARTRGLTTPSQVSPGPGSPYRNEAAALAYTDFDPERAEALLDGIGFRRPGPGRARRTPDGRPVTFFLDFTAFSGRGPADLVIADWERVGVRAIARQRARSLFAMELRGRQTDFTVWTGESDFFPLVDPRYYVPSSTQSYWAPSWGIWYERGGLHGSAAAAADGRATAPPEGHPARRAMELFDRIGREPDGAQRVRLFHEIQAIAGEEVFTISVGTSPPQVVACDPRLRNVPDQALYGYIYATPGNAKPETFWLETDDGEDAPVDPVVARSLDRITPMPALHAAGGTGGTGDAGGGSGGGWLWVAGGLGLVLLGLRYRFIGRRLLLMVPTLLVLSVLVFAVIEAPPGDFLLSKMIELEEQGDASARDQIEEMRRTFGLDQPKWKQYADWAGLTWFTSFDPADTGLLQGDLGRSMATSQPVNLVVGDRLALTLAISLGTIAFTWVLAIPIGIFSAVKQYSLADYVLTLVGFLGMCIPPFLFALILGALAGVSGLFSAEYAGVPGWSVGKFVDLLKHVWVPVVVLGTGGTAAMIRVMRANLLDELNKPYVVTARAKGVAPMRLLFRYPVRMALNPFISGIGGLFPQLISGGAIVAMVLSLPTVGPLLLEALLLEDMYLAGSLLMVLSVLGIVGTLVSDLLLLWLDPRIRFESGSR